MTNITPRKYMTLKEVLGGNKNPLSCFNITIMKYLDNHPDVYNKIKSCPEFSVQYNDDIIRKTMDINNKYSLLDVLQKSGKYREYLNLDATLRIGCLYFTSMAEYIAGCEGLEEEMKNNNFYRDAVATHYKIPFADSKHIDSFMHDATIYDMYRYIEQYKSNRIYKLEYIYNFINLMAIPIIETGFNHLFFSYTPEELFNVLIDDDDSAIKSAMDEINNAGYLRGKITSQDTFNHLLKFACNNIGREKLYIAFFNSHMVNILRYGKLFLTDNENNHDLSKQNDIDGEN